MSSAATMIADKVMGRLAGIPAGVTLFDGGVTTTPTGPYVVLFAGADVEDTNRYIPHVDGNELTYRLIVVNDSSAGVRVLVPTVRDLVNDMTLVGFRGDGILSWIDSTGPLLRDDEVEGRWKYSQTLVCKARLEP